MELQEFVTQSGDVVNELFDLTEFDRDLPEQPVVSSSLSKKHILHLEGGYGADPDQCFTYFLAHLSTPPDFADVAPELLCFGHRHFIFSTAASITSTPPLLFSLSSPIPFFESLTSNLMSFAGHFRSIHG